MGGPQRDGHSVGRKETREEKPRLLTPSDILPLEDTEGKERTCLLCPGLSRWPVPSAKEVRTVVILEELFCLS